MGLKVHIRPTPEQIAGHTGIGRVVHAQFRYLPRHDIELVDSPSDADVTAGHATAQGLPGCDIIHSHGLYWTAEQPGWREMVDDFNREIVASYRRARAISVPSEWVAEPFRRDMHLQPWIIGHGINFKEWEPQENKGYILWNKNRVDPVCDPRPAYELALRGYAVVATFAPPNSRALDNLKLTGLLPERDMRPIIASADLYLATTPETFGIGILEALACGVPVLAWRWGNAPALVEHQVTGWLCEPGDVEGLVEGVEWLRQRRRRVSQAARERARRYDWPEVIGAYVEMYQAVAEEKRAEGHSYSVVIPCHNYAQYVGAAIDSALAQTTPPERVVVVDDGSTDGSREVIAQRAAEHPDRVLPIYQENRGVAAARNAGIQEADTPYIICLDADDELAPEYAETLLREMQWDRALGVAYTGITLIHEDDGVSGMASWPPEFDWSEQARPGWPPGNCIPTAAMFRREMWRRAGGFKQDYAPAEDAEFWTRGLSLGFEARRVTPDGLFRYRVHEGSALRTQRMQVHPATWQPWRVDRNTPMAAPTPWPPLVRSYSRPIVTIVLVSPDLAPHRVNDIDRCQGQTLRGWEAFALGTPHAHGDLSAAPWLRWRRHVHAALAEARAPVVIIAHTTAAWQPDTLRRMLSAYAHAGGGVVIRDGCVALATEEAAKFGAKKLEALMGACGCGAGGAGVMRIKQALGMAVGGDGAPPDGRGGEARPGMVRMEYVGGQAGPITYRVNGRSYIGDALDNRYADVLVEDVPHLERLGVWRMAQSEAARTVTLEYTGQGGPRVFLDSSGSPRWRGGASARDRHLVVSQADAAYILARYPESWRQILPPPGAAEGAGHD